MPSWGLFSASQSAPSRYLCLRAEFRAMSQMRRRLTLFLCLLGQVFQHALSSGIHVGDGIGLDRKLLQDSPPRPQNPKPPLPYTGTNVTFMSFVGPDVTLAGTLTVPDTPPPHPAVLLISGAGPSDRDATFFGHKWFLVLSDHLTRNGIAVLRYDDRGVGESTGNHSLATTYDFADDAIGGVRYLKTREDIDPNAVGMLGHSEGGIIAPVAVSKLKDTGRYQWMPDFLVLAAPPALLWERTNDVVVKSPAESAVLSPEEVEAVREGNRRLIELVKGADNVEDVDDEIMETIGDMEEEYEKILNLEAVNMAEDGPAVTVETQMSTFRSPWYRAYVTLDPVTYFKRVDVPVLTLLGTNDVQVSPGLHEAKIREGFSGNPDAKLTVVEGANHMFQLSGSGALTELVKINETIAPVVMDMMSSWILEQTTQSN